MRRRFFSTFGFCITGVILLFLIGDIIEHLDTFLDKDVATFVVIKYYLYYIPYYTVLTLPVATLMSTVFTVGTMAKNNEIVALKSLGYSLYQVLFTYLGAGFIVFAASFFMAEYIVPQTNDLRMKIRREYLDKGYDRSEFSNLEIREGNRIVNIGFFKAEEESGIRTRIETIENNTLVSRIDGDSLVFRQGTWIIKNGYRRDFSGQEESITRIDSLPVKLSFTPREILRAQSNPEHMGISDLSKYISRLKKSGRSIDKWLTEYHLRFSYPFSNVVIILFGLPLAYTRRKKNIAVGFGISLSVCFFYFGLVKVGQTLGQKGNLHPLTAAWIGNLVMIGGSAINLIKTRK